MSTRKLKLEEKVKIVQEAEQIGFTETSLKYNVSSRQIYRWRDKLQKLLFVIGKNKRIWLLCRYFGKKYLNKKPLTIDSQGFNYFKRDPVGIRTPNLLIRSEVLYPVELRNLKLGYKYTIFIIIL